MKNLNEQDTKTYKKIADFRDMEAMFNFAFVLGQRDVLQIDVLKTQLKKLEE